MAGLLAAGVSPAWAQSATEVSFADRIVLWVFDQQRIFHRSLAQAMRGLAGDGGIMAAWSLIGGSLVYGVFHAAGPGHGKAMLTAYLLTHRQHITRGVLLAAAAALCQGITAIAIVYGPIMLVGWLPRDTAAAVTWSERLSYGLVVAIGLILLWSAARGLLRRLRSAPDVASASHDHGHHGHDHCGHTHLPTGAQVDAVTGLRTAIGVVLSIGLRPCSGAILVLILAQVLGLAWVGVGAVLAMSIGTALTVAGLAFIAVNLRHWAGVLIARRGRENTIEMAVAVLKLAGGAAILWLGLSLLLASFGPDHPLGLG